jgi:hypothetical protein
MTEIMNSHDVDQEASSPKEYLDGYVDFAEFIASDGQLSIFWQFRYPAACNLFYLEQSSSCFGFRYRR